MMNNTAFKKGDIVLISPELTHQIDWIEGTIIEIEKNQHNIILIILSNSV